jgi:hypothetical protein
MKNLSHCNKKRKEYDHLPNNHNRHIRSGLSLPSNVQFGRGVTLLNGRLGLIDCHVRLLKRIKYSNTKQKKFMQPPQSGTAKAKSLSTPGGFNLGTMPVGSAKRRMLVVSDSDDDDGLEAVTFQTASPLIHSTDKVPKRLLTVDNISDTSISASSQVASGFDLDSLLQTKSKQKQSGTDLATLERVLDESTDADDTLTAEFQYPQQQPTTLDSEIDGNQQRLLECFDLFDEGLLQAPVPDKYRHIQDYLVLDRLIIASEYSAKDLLRFRKCGN